MRRTRRTALPLVALAALGALNLGACGGSDDPATSSGPDYSVSATGSTASVQSLGGRRTVRVTVRNRGTRALPNATVTLDGLTRDVATEDGGSGRGVDPRRPVWIVDRPPVGASTDNADTWSLGRLPPGRSATFRWRLTAAVPGRWDLRWRVSAGVDEPGVVTSPDDTISGRLRVTIADRPREVEE